MPPTLSAPLQQHTQHHPPHHLPHDEQSTPPQLQPRPTSPTTPPTSRDPPPYTTSQTSSPDQPVTTESLPTYNSLPRTRWGTRGQYASEQEYLDALRAFVREKEYVDPDGNALVGFFGRKTGKDYAGGVDADVNGVGALGDAERRGEGATRRRTGLSRLFGRS